MTIRLSGLVSGLDTDALVEKLISAQRTRLVDKYYQQNQTISWKQEFYRETNTKLLALRSAAFDLRLQSNVQGKAVTSSNENAVKATANAGAVPGLYTLEVVQLAKTASKESAPVTGYTHVSADQSFTLTGEYGSAKITVEYGQTLQDVVKSINAVSDQTGIRASYDANINRFYLTSTNTGSQAKVNFNDTNGFMGNVLKMDYIGAKGEDAIVKFNGGSEITVAKNQFVLNGIEFDIRKAGETASLTVTNDVDKAVEKIKAFVEAYNNVVTYMDTKINEKRYKDYKPLTDEQRDSMKDSQIEKWEEKARSGLLKADSLYSGIYNSLRMAATGWVEGLSKNNKYTSLSSIGIQSSEDWLDHGKLYIDEDKLRGALNTNPDAVYELFNKMDADGNYVGLTGRIYNDLTTSMKKITDKAGSGITSIDNSYWGQEISRNETYISEGEKRLEKLTERYYAQYTAMEKALSKLQSQSDWLTQQLSSYSS